MFTNSNLDYSDVQNNFKNIAFDFCKYYYKLLNTDFSKLHELYKPESKFTFLEEEFIGFENLLNKIVYSYNINKFHHDINSIDSQPIGNMTLLITVTGYVGVNNINNNNKFVETFILQKDQNSNFYVYNTIFRHIE